MFHFGGITHIISNPTGHTPGWNFSLVGAVPASMLEARTPTASDIMGGRVQKDGKAYHGRKWETVADIVAEAAKHPEVKLCSSATCACRTLFPAPPDGLLKYQGRSISARPKTVREMVPAVGAQVFVQFEQVEVLCTVVDVKNTFNRVRLEVTPELGNGSQWVELPRVVRMVEAR